MQAPKEYRDWCTWGKMKKNRKYGWAKKNGVLNWAFFDCYTMEQMLNNSKKNYKRHKEKRIRE